METLDIKVAEKKCNKCKEIKPVSFFGKEKRAKNGYKPRCKKCCNEEYNSNYHKYREAKLKQLKKYYSENADSIKEKSNDYYKKRDPRIRIDVKSKWRDKNRIRIRKKHNSYIQNRLKNDVLFKAERLMRSMVYRLLKDKTEKTSNILGYTSLDLINRIGNDLSAKHIDHKIPISWFVLGTDIKLISHLENIQLLSQSENVRKHNCFADPVSINYFTLIENQIKPKYKPLIKIL